MTYELKALLEIDYTEISELYQKVLNYKADTKDDAFALFTPEYTKYSIDLNFPTRELFFGIYAEGKLIGTIGATRVPILFQGEELLGSAITCYAIDPAVYPFPPDAKIQIFQDLIQKVKEHKVDFIWVTFVEENNADEMKLFKNELLFTRMNKNVESLVKLLGSEGVDILREKKQMNVILAKMAKMMAGMETMDLPGGTIRKATPKDYPFTINLLNDYNKNLPITKIWTSKSFQHHIEVASLLNEIDYLDLKTEYPNTPFGFHIEVWERDQRIIAAILYRVVRIRFKNGDAPFGFWDYIAFDQELEFDAKKAFLLNMYNALYRKAIIINVFLPDYDFKTFDKSGFMTERRKTPLLIFPLSEKGQKLVEIERLAQFYLTTDTDFAI